MDKSINLIQERLKEPLPREDIEFRVCRASLKTRKVNVLAYLTARGIMRRLDEVFGINHWKDEYEVLKEGVKCKLSVFLGGEWVTKEDVASFTNIEALKGAFSDSLKRAGVKFGIGRYLYDLPDYWVEVLAERPKNTKNPVHYHSSEGLVGFWEEPELPEWALPNNKPKATVPADYQKLLDELKSANLLTKSKYDQYITKLTDSYINESQSKLIWEQLQLIKKWGDSIMNNDAITSDEQKKLYRQIIGSSENTIESVRAELNRLQKQKREVA